MLRRSLALLPLMAIPCAVVNIAQADDLLGTYRAALQNDAEFLAAEYQQLATIEAHPQARAALLPQVTLSGNANITEVNNDQDGSYGGNGIELNITQSLYSGRNNAALSQANSQVQQANADYAAAQQSLLLRSAERYFAILAAQDNLQFAHSEKDAIQRQLEQAERRFDVGLTAVTDVKEAQAQYDLAVANEIEAENQLATANEALRVLTNKVSDIPYHLKEEVPLNPPTPEDSEAWVAVANDNNLALQAARLAAEIAKKSVSFQRADHLPSVDLIGSYSNNHSDGVIGDTETGQLRLQVTIPLYSGGATSANIRRANANFNLARQQLDSQRRATEQQTRDAYRNVLADISRVRALKQALVSTQAAADATQAGFDVGTRTAVEVLSALRDTYNAQNNYSSARYNFILNTLRLKQAAGILKLTDLEVVNQWLMP